jgi:glycosyltransferase involved in cell wall biosynthesis
MGGAAGNLPLMRVLQLIPSLVVGGAESMAARLAQQLASWGHDVTVVSMHDPVGSWIESELQTSPIALHFLGKRPGVDLRMVLRISRLLARVRPDVLHTHLHVLTYAFPALAAWPRCRVVHTVHTGADLEVTPLGRVVQHLAFRTRVLPVAVGGDVAKSIRAVYGIPPPRVIYNGIPVSKYATAAGTPAARQEIRASLGIGPGSPVFVCVGRLNPIKNHPALIRAFASERIAATGAHLLIAGDGGHRNELEAQTRAAGLAERVHFLGDRSDVPRVLAAADVFVLASTREGNPLAVMEAMAAGKAVVATTVGSVPELVVPGTGRLVPAGREEALEAAMYDLASDLAMVRTMGEAAARSAAERFDASLMAKAYEQLYEEIT